MTEKREALLEGARKWGWIQHAQTEDRDPLVLACLEVGISKEALHQATGLGRSTIDRIERVAKGDQE